MKQHIVKAFSMLAVAAALSAAAVYAQTCLRTLEARIPFDFVVGNQTLAAGDYTVKGGDGAGSIMIKSTEQGSASFALADSVVARKTPAEGRLVFNKYGDRYFLATVWEPGNDIGRSLRMSKREKEMASRVVKDGAVVVAAVLR